MRVSDIVRQSFDFSPVTSLQALQETSMLESHVRGFKVSDATAEKTLHPIFEYLNENKDDVPPLVLQGPYGAGKTHTLLFVAGLFSLPNIKKDIQLTHFNDLEQLVNDVTKSKCKVISVNCLDGHDMSFGNLMQEKITKAFTQKGETFPHSTVYTVIRELSDLMSPTRRAFENHFTRAQVETLILDLNSGVQPSVETLKRLEDAWEQCFKVPLGIIHQPFETILTSLTEATIKSGYRSSIILLDEWSSYFQIRMGQSAILSDLASLQQLLEYSLISRNALKIIAVSHVSLKEKGYWVGNQDALQTLSKVAGRFRVLQIQSAVTLQSISQMFLRQNQFKQTFSSIPISWPIKAYENLFQKIHDTYPVHPFLLEILPHLIAKHGQAERTIKHFLGWAFARIADKDFMGPEHISIIDTSDVFDYYFSGSEGVILRDESTINSIKQLLSKAEQIAYGPDVAKALIVQYLTYASVPASVVYKNGLTIKKICNLIQLSEKIVTSILEILSGENILFNPDLQLYAFIPSGTVSSNELEREISNKVEEISYKDAIDLCARKHGLDSYYKDYYNPFKHRIEFIYKFEDDIHLQDKNVKIVFMLPSDESYTIDICDISKKTTNTLFVQARSLPSAYFLKRYAVIIGMQNKSGKTEYEQAYLRDRLSLVAGILGNQFKSLFRHSNVDVWRAGDKVSTLVDNWDPIVFDILNELYNGCPDFDLDELKSDRRVISQLMPYVLQEKGQLPVQSEVRRFFLVIMQGLDIIDINDDQYQLCFPRPEKSRAWEVWRQITMLDHSEGIAKVYEKLGDIPFGLPATIVELLIGAYLRQNCGKLLRHNEITPLELNDLILKEVTTYKSRRFIVITPQTAQEWKDQFTETRSFTLLSEIVKKVRDANNVLDNVNLKNHNMQQYLEDVGKYIDNDSKTVTDELLHRANGIVALAEMILAENNMLQGIELTFTSFSADTELVSGLKNHVNAFENGGISEMKSLIGHYKSLFDKCYSKFIREHQALHMFVAKALEERKINYSKTVLPDELVPCHRKPIKNTAYGISFVCQNHKCRYALGELDDRKRRIIECIDGIEKDVSILVDEVEKENHFNQTEISIKREKRVRKEQAISILHQQINDFEKIIKTKSDWPVTQLISELTQWAVTLVVAIRRNSK